MLELSKFLMVVILSHLILQMRKQELRGVTQLANSRNSWMGECLYWFAFCSGGKHHDLEREGLFSLCTYSQSITRG